MAIMREYLCAAHGEFESSTGQCPRGCSKRFVVQQIRTAPAFRSGRTKRADKEMDNLAGTYGMSNIKVSSDGASVMENLRRSSPEKFVPSWGEVDHAAPGFSQRKDAKVFNAGMPAGPSIESVKPAFTPLSQKTVVVGRHEAKVT